MEREDVCVLTCDQRIDGKEGPLSGDASGSRGVGSEVQPQLVGLNLVRESRVVLRA